MLQPMNVRLCDADRKEYGIEQEWLPIHAALFTSVRASALRAWEKETGIKILDFLSGDVDVRSIELVTTTMWYACKVNGVQVPPFADFDPFALDGEIVTLDLKPEGDDVDPPASSSTDNSAETPQPGA